MKRRNVETAEGPRGQGVEAPKDRCFLELTAFSDKASNPLWVLLIPDGQVDSENGEFFLDKVSAAETIAFFEKRETDLPVDYEHRSTQQYAPSDGIAPAAGWIKELRYVVNQGLYGLVKWTQRAWGMIQADEYRYLSPTVWIDKETRRVLRLVSAALTHTPAIKGGLPVAASRYESFQESNAMPEGTETTGGDPGILIGEIKTLLGIGDIEDESNINNVLRAIRDALKAKGSEGKSEGEGNEEAEVASSARKALGLSTGAGAQAVEVAINTLKQGASETQKLEAKINSLAGKVAEHDIADLLKPYQAKGVIDPKNEQDYKIFANMARQCPNDCKHLLDQRVAMLPMSGTTTAPAAPSAHKNEEELIANAVKEHDGNYGNGIVALQTRLIDQECERTQFARPRVVKLLEQQYPKIFGAAA